MARNESSKAHQQNARARLAALREKKTPKKAAQSRALWPEIKAVLDNGHTLKAVCDCLAEDGIDITVQTLGSYITRMRRKSVPLEAAAGSGSASFVESTLPDTEAERITTSKRTKSSDPLANVRDRQGRRSAFDYRPELADPNELI
ncbi:MAG: hypothetical protein WAM39_19420 [Bryobacteraceae bacterium]